MLMFWQCCFVTVTLWIGVVGQNRDDYQLILVQMIWRHGDRAPIKLYPNDPNSEDDFPEGLGQLSALGKQQHYSLGQLLRFVYDDYITTNATEIHVLSATDDRCLDSASANLAKFYRPKEGARFNPNVHWQPITIHYNSNAKDDKYLNQFADCPRAEMEFKNFFNSSEAREFNEKHKKMFMYLREHSGIPANDRLSAGLLPDTLMIEKMRNLTIPAWVDPYWDELMEVSNTFFYWIFKDRKMLRLRGGPLFGLMIDKMKKKISGHTPKLKVQVYSAHDSGVAVLLSALNLLPTKGVPYCATLIFELWRGPSQDYFVRTIYLNSTEPELVMQEPHILELGGCDKLCPMDHFVNYFKDVIPENWEEECKVPG